MLECTYNDDCPDKESCFDGFCKRKFSCYFDYKDLVVHDIFLYNNTLSVYNIDSRIFVHIA